MRGTEDSMASEPQFFGGAEQLNTSGFGRIVTIVQEDGRGITEFTSNALFLLLGKTIVAHVDDGELVTEIPIRAMVR